MLTDKAKKYLSTLERRPFVPTEDVEKIILDSGYPCFPKWLDFHEKYAGYVELLGKDKAVWGLAHQSPTWLGSLAVEVSYDKKENSYDIVCADVHPSYNYVICESGEFMGFRSESFDIYVERKAVGYDFSFGFDVKSVSGSELSEDVIDRVMGAENILIEASDAFSEYYFRDEFLLVKSLGDYSVRGWIRG